MFWTGEIGRNVSFIFLNAQRHMKSEQPSQAPDLAWCTPRLRALRDGIHSVLYGQDEAVSLAMICFLSGGHLLIEDVPGVGKTTLAQAFSACLGLDTRRIQFTADILPGDILGVNIYNPKSETFVFHPGPIFTNVLLADEINRAEPRAQSALLEAMFERQVTLDGTVHALPSPFFVIATQNPVDFSGTFPLPDSQLDRFLLRMSMGYPELSAEREILRATATKQPLSAILTPEDVRHLLSEVERVFASDEIIDDILRITEKTRNHPDLLLGISTRAMLDFLRAARARALLLNRAFVLPDDLSRLCVPVLAHRIRTTSQAAVDVDEILSEICKTSL